MAADLRSMYDTDSDVKKVIDVAKGLEGLRRQDGIHAAAVVITKDSLTEYLPIQRKPEAGKPIEMAPVVTQYEMNGVESLGLLKMDFLGLRNLDVISDTLEPSSSKHRDVDLDIDNVSLDDAEDLRAARSWRHHRGVPARGRRHAGAGPIARSRQVRGRRRARGAVPTGSDVGEHAQRLRRHQERPQSRCSTSTPTPRRSWPIRTA